MKSLYLKYKQLSLLPKFLINSILLLTLWFAFFKIFRHILIVDFVYEKFIFWFSVLQLKISKFILTLLGYNVEIIGKIVKIQGSYGVHLDKGCLGRNTLGLFVGFLLAYPSDNYSKIWFIFVGIVIFLFLNILRITTLAIFDACCPQALDFNHHFTFKIIIYFVIFILWAIWIKKFSFKKTQQKIENTSQP